MLTLSGLAPHCFSINFAAWVKPIKEKFIEKDELFISFPNKLAEPNLANKVSKESLSPLRLRNVPAGFNPDLNW